MDNNICYKPGPVDIPRTCTFVVVTKVDIYKLIEAFFFQCGGRGPSFDIEGDRVLYTIGRHMFVDFFVFDLGMVGVSLKLGERKDYSYPDLRKKSNVFQI